MERRMLAEGDAEDFTAQLRECSKAESGLQSRLHATAETLTEAEVRAAHLRDRRDEPPAELDRVAEVLGSEAEPATETLDVPEREEIERKLERLARPRAALGSRYPVTRQVHDTTH